MVQRTKRAQLEEPSAEVQQGLEAIAAAAASHHAAQRLRDETYAEFLAAIRQAARIEPAPSLHLLARAAGISVTRVKQIVERRVSKRDPGLGAVPSRDSATEDAASEDGLAPLSEGFAR